MMRGVSVHPVLGLSLAAGTRLLPPLTSTDLVDPLDRMVALTPWPAAHESTVAVFFGGITILMSAAPDSTSASYIDRVS